MDTIFNKSQAVRTRYDLLQKEIELLCRIYDIPDDSIALGNIQDFIGEYADAEIALHTHRESPLVDDSQMKAAHDLYDELSPSVTIIVHS